MTTAIEDPEYIHLLKQTNRWMKFMIGSAFLIGIPPLLGLAGTALGMTRAFDTMGVPGGTDPEELAENISLALMTTAGGLVASAVFLLLFFVFLTFWLMASSKVKNFGNSTPPQK